MRLAGGTGHRAVAELVRRTFSKWLEDNPFRLSAALAYYTLFSMAPLLVLAVGIAGLMFGEDAVRGRIFGQLKDLVGADSAATVQAAVAAASLHSSGVIASVVGVVTLLIGASAVFAELQDALNTIWKAAPSPAAGWRNVARKRLLSLAMVLVIGFLLLVSLALSAIVNALGEYLGGYLPASAALIEAVNFLLSFAVTSVLFGAIFKILPDVALGWEHVWIGGMFTAAMFTLGKSLIGIYLGRSVIGSAYGAAGALAVLLVWIYYSSMILFLGAAFTEVYTRRRDVRDDVRNVEAATHERIETF